ncbi:zinc-binding protein A33-like isoform X2 [Narcine bancroftii]|uniref:zinc-binding protein A33-like isoform X2 n=1 Tax=Narcine bancroftii TaxID=1343680 RepID=UPI0038316389
MSEDSLRFVLVQKIVRVTELEKQLSMANAQLEAKEKELRSMSKMLQESGLDENCQSDEMEVLRVKLVETIAELQDEKKARNSLELLKQKVAGEALEEGAAESQLAEKYAECKKLTIACMRQLLNKDAEINMLKEKLRYRDGQIPDSKPTIDESTLRESETELETLKTILKDLEELLHLKNKEIKRITEQEGITTIKRNRIYLKLDPTTADPRYLFSSDQLSVRWDENPSEIADRQKQYAGTYVVWGTKGFTSGKRYWEVTVDEGTVWSVGVSPQATKSRKWVRASRQDQYWTVLLWNIGKTRLEKRTMGKFVNIIQLRKIGVYLNYEDEKVTFYNIETERSVHEFTGTFQGPLYPVFRFFFATSKNHRLSVF